MSKIIVVGTLAFDTIETPFGKTDKIVGGACTYISLSAAYFNNSPHLISVVGEDFPNETIALFKERGINTEGLQIKNGEKTFFWSGKYHQDMNTRDTLDTQLNVLESFDPIVPKSYQDCDILMLGNLTPSVQMKVIKQMETRPKLIVLDTMNFWMEIAMEDLKKVIKEIEYLQQTDKEFWKIYGLGEYGNISGLIYENVKYVDSMPDCKLVAYGLDFGYSIDPSACVAVYKRDDELYLKEILYQRELTNQDLAEALLPIVGRDEVICDSAEPKSIEEIYRLGLNAKPATKGRDSILNGIDILKRYKINVVNSSNLRREFRMYKWATDKNGNSLQKPIGQDHLMDALRYVALIHLKENNRGWYAIR